MIRKDYSSVSKIALILLLMVAAMAAHAQPKNRQTTGSDYNSFLDTQWWLGLRVGTNYSQPTPGTRYSSFEPIDYPLDSLDKSYQSFGTPGIILGLDIAFYHKGFTIGLQPAYKSMKYTYFNDLSWAGDSPLEQFDTRYEIQQSLSYLELPLAFKYELIRRGTFRPFVLVGAQYSFLLSAKKSASISHTDYLSGAPRTYDGGSVQSDAKSLFRNYAGVLAGVGTGFDFLNIRTVLEVTYVLGLTNISRASTRYDTSNLTTLGEVNDDIKLSNLNVSLSFVFPLRFIDNTFQPYKK